MISRPNVAIGMDLRALWQNRKSAVNKFDVHPIDQQRRLPHLHQRAEPDLPKPPSGTTRSSADNITSRMPTRARRKLGLVCQ